MRKFRKNTTDRFIISLENGPISLSDKFKENYHWSDGQYMQSMTTEKGVRIIVHGKIAKDGSNTNLHVTFEKEKGFERADLDDAIEFIRGTGAKAKQVKSPESGFIHDHIDDILIKGKTIDASANSTPAEEPKATTKKRSFPFSFKRDEKKLKVGIEKQKQQLIEANHELINALGKKKNESWERKDIHPIALGILERISNHFEDKKLNSMGLDELRTLNANLSEALSTVSKVLPAKGQQSENLTEELHSLFIKLSKPEKTAQIPPMAKEHDRNAKKHEFQDRIDKMKVTAEGNEKLLSKINKYEKHLEKSGVLSKPESTSIIRGQLAGLEKQCEQYLSVKGRPAAAPPNK